METIDMNILKEGHAGALVNVLGSTMNYGVIRMTGNKLVFYTGLGLREMWSPNMNDEQKELAERLKKKSEEELRISGHIGEINLADIRRVLF